MDNLEGYYTYDEITAQLLIEKGVPVEFHSWRAAVDWNKFSAVIIRSTWDYQTDVEAFLSVLKTIDESSALLLNPLDVVRWNVKKTYLLELEHKGVPIIPTHYGHGLTDEDLRRFETEFEGEELIVKPIIGANSEGIFRLQKPLNSAHSREAVAHYSDKPFFAQPFLNSIITEGEISLIYTRSEFSHAIIKRPKSGDFRVQEEHGGVFELYEPEAEALMISEKALQAVPGYSADDPLLFARVDLVRLAHAGLAVMELELIEPSLYLNLDEQSPRRFAEAIEKQLGLL